MEYKEFRQEIESLGFFKRKYFYYLSLFLFSFGGLLLSLYLITVTDNMWAQVLNAIMFGFFSVQLGMFGHDLSHNQVFKNKTLNTVSATIVWNLLCGLNQSCWYKKHNTHHKEVNRLHHDPDLNIPFIFSPKQIEGASWGQKLMLKYQYVLFFFALPFIYTSWIINNFIDTVKEFSLRAFIELSLISMHFLVLFYIVFSHLNLSTSIVFLIISFMVIGVYMSLVFAPNHKGMDIVEEAVDWKHQIILTRNLFPNLFLFHMMGGLNYQIEHHLFPNMARINYIKVAPFVKKFAQDNKLEYYETTWFQSMREIFDSLKETSKHHDAH